MIRSWLAKHVFYPTQDALRGLGSLRRWRDLEQSQWWSPDQLRAFQDTKLRQLIRHATSQTPFYRERFERVFIRPADVRSIDDLSDLPLLLKDDIRDGHEDMIADSHRGELMSSCTSGSTGSPLIFSVGRRRCGADLAARIRAHRWFDVCTGDPVIYLWGSRIETDRQDRLRAIRDWLINERLLRAFELSDEQLHGYADKFLYIKPYALYSYSSTLRRFAQFVHEHRPELKGVIRRVAFATGEQLLPQWREEIIRYLECSVAEEYGCREGGLIAHECPEEAYHLTAENIIVEILDDDGKVLPSDEEGRVVVTNLDAYAMPFIRYDTGDRAALRAGECACWLPLPMMWRPTGRSFEFLETNDGTQVTGVSLSRDLKEIEGLTHYRVIQEARDRVRILAVTNSHYRRAEGERQMRCFVKARIGDATQVIIEYVDDLPPHASGKYRYIINAIAESATPH